jgi:hypothetical protein
MEPVYLYPKVRKRFPRLSAQSCAAMENSIKSKYRKLRYKVIWTGEASLPSARYPQPTVTTATSWRPSYEPAGKDGGDLVPCVSLPMLDGQRWTLQLRGGKEFISQLESFRQLVSGEAVKCDMYVTRKRADEKRNGMKDRDSGDQQVFHRIMVKMVGWFPRRPRDVRSGTLFCTSTPEAMAVAVNAKEDRLFSIHGDHIKRWYAEHDRRLQNWSDDQKVERRGKRADYQSRREAACKKHYDRIDTAIKTIVAQIVGYADRRKFAEIKWVESDMPFMEAFQWFAFHSRMEVKADAAGIIYTKGEDNGEKEDSPTTAK